jgi:RNA polymerase sigma-70 factor (ECF subfamily)
MSPGEISAARRAIQLIVTDDGRNLQQALAAARFEAIFRSCYPRVLAYVWRRTESREVAEEIVSETFLIAWRRLEAVPLEPLPWLLGTARKVLGHRHRSERRRAAHLTVSSLEGVEVAEPETPIAERLARRESLAGAFAALPDRDREILTLVAWEGLTPREGRRSSAARRPPSRYDSTAPAGDSRKSLLPPGIHQVRAYGHGLTPGTVPRGRNEREERRHGD